jgi:1-phosphatidylinositol-3-phosphate 5-kinase
MVTSDYRQHFNRTGGTKASASSIMVECMPEENMRHGVHRESEWNVIDYPGTDAGTDIDAPSKRKEESVIAIRSELGPEKSGNEVAVKCYFATQFDALRKDCGCENLYIESLARCVKWDPSGGKSGVAFLKSKGAYTAAPEVAGERLLIEPKFTDDRFIIKELNKAEMKWFADLGQPYFDYMSCALRKGQPTVLAKIFGVYGLSFSNKGRHKKMNVMVMENIYYKKTITKQFDLKGSTRNRFVEVQAGKNCVLLDENLVNRKSPASRSCVSIRDTDASTLSFPLLLQLRTTPHSISASTPKQTWRQPSTMTRFSSPRTTSWTTA